MGATKEMAVTFLVKVMLLDEEEAAVYASVMETEPNGQAGGGFGGGR